MPMPRKRPDIVKAATKAIEEEWLGLDRTEDLPDIDFAQGGQWLVDAVERYGVTESGQLIRFNPLIREALLLMGDFRVAEVFLTGAAQVFKSLITWQLAAATLTIGGKNWLWVYADGNQIDKLVPTYWKPIINRWERAAGLEKKAEPGDSKSNRLWMSARGTGGFASANNPNEGRAGEDGLAAASKGAVATSVDLLLFDEASQSTEAAKEPFYKRTLQGEIPSRPRRKTGTPGRGAGIELDVERAHKDFYPHARCSNCGEVSPLHPKGWLLKNAEVDTTKPSRYLSELGKPLVEKEISYWHHTDPADPIESAIYACPNCAHPITRDERLNGWFQCRKSGVRLKDWLESLPKEFPQREITAGLTLSPLIRDSLNTSGAASIIRDGLKAKVPQDWQQQELGIPSSTATGGITRDMLIRSIASKIPADRPKIVTGWGLDQGTNFHYLAIIRYRLAFQRTGQRPLSNQEIYERSHREVLFLNKITEDELLPKIEELAGGGMDCDPFRDWADKIRRASTGTVLMDQRGKKEMADEITKKGTVEIGARKIPVTLVDTHQMQNYILNLFAGNDEESGDCRIKLPQWIDPYDMSPGSVARQLTTSTRDLNTLAWIRPIDHDDDLLKALMFAETWFWMYCHRRLPFTDWAAAAGR